MSGRRCRALRCAHVARQGQAPGKVEVIEAGPDEVLYRHSEWRRLKAAVRRLGWGRDAAVRRLVQQAAGLDRVRERKRRARARQRVLWVARAAATRRAREEETP